MSAPNPAGTLIAARYQLQRRLAQGGMAEVWLAVDLTLDRKVAVKWLKPLLASDEVVAERFRREAIAAASLNHPNIVAVHDVFEHEGRQAVVMQLVDGKSLRQLLDTQKRLSPELTGHIGACTAAALHHAHENNFVHRDVKPGNIMITPDGRVLLTDFGIAKALAGGDDLTSENIMMGTAKYLSPEQVRGKKLDGRADLYSLGLVLYECLAGRVPFLGETDADTALARLQRDPTDLSRLRATLPTSLVTIIHQLLARNPAHRPATGADLVSALESAAAEGPPPIDDTPHEHSPVAPFSAGRLRRAPSDLEGRADDRRRATRHHTPSTGNPRDGDDDSGGSLRKRLWNRTTGSTPTVTTPRTTGSTADSASTGSTSSTSPTSSTGSTSSTSPTSSTPTGQVDPQHAPTLHASPFGPLPAQRRIPGEPERITGAIPIQDTTVTARANGSTNRRDHTPSAGAGQRGAPAKGMSQSARPSVTVLGGLILLAVIVAIVLWMSVRFGGDDSGGPSAVLPDDAQGQNADITAGDGASDGAAVPGLDDATTEAGADGAAATGSGGIASITAYDPDGDDGSENDELAVLAAADGDPSTNWRTACYSGEFMGAKRGVGLVVTFDAPTQRALTVDVGSGPYIVDFLVSTGPDVPASIDGWDAQVGERAFADDAGTITSNVPSTPVTHMLVLLKQLGGDSSCSDARPFRGLLGEIELV